MKPNQKLELTWIGKGQEPKLEPRILIEQPEYSYGDPNTGNMLIQGDNLLALKALEQEYAGKVKCIYKRSLKSHYVILTKTIQNFADIFFKSFNVSRLEFHQFILHFVPKLFDSIEFWTVRRQEIESQPLLSQHL